MSDDPTRPSPEDEAVTRQDRDRARTLNVVELLIIERAGHYCVELIALAKPAGRLSSRKCRASLVTAARNLLTKIGELEKEMTS